MTNAVRIQHLHAAMLTNEDAGEVAMAITHLFLNISSVLGVCINGLEPLVHTIRQPLMVAGMPSRLLTVTSNLNFLEDLCLFLRSI